jgi:farnesyl-diphosphate farnesyltransferase
MADLAALLAKTSRTFALAIPELPRPLSHQVTLAYLLLRIADTIEDAAGWGSRRKAAELLAFRDQVRSDEARESFSARVLDARPEASADCLELLAASDEVLAELRSLPVRSRAVVRSCVACSAEGMAAVVSRTRDGSIALASIAELRDYCYIVAGVVGEMLTELFLLHTPRLQPVAAMLRERARFFGEGLQLTNILKDEEDDARGGRRFRPPTVDRSQVFALARAGLAEAASYVRILAAGRAPRGVLGFARLPVLLATETLALVERLGSGAKVPRARVAELLATVSTGTR